MAKKTGWKKVWGALCATGRGIGVASKTLTRALASSVAWTTTTAQQMSRPRATPIHEDFIEIQNLSGSLKSFSKKLLTSKSLIGIIIGARGTGKSALGLKLLENIKAKNNSTVYALGFSSKTLPSWIHAVDSIEQIKNNGTVLVDEGGITFSSRKSMTTANQLLSELLLIARHKDLSIVFITQNSSNLEINTLRQADFLLLKPSSLLQKDFERKKIKDIYQEVHADFTEHKDIQGVTYFYSDWYRGFATNALPSFWTEAVSKSWKK